MAGCQRVQNAIRSACLIWAKQLYALASTADIEALLGFARGSGMQAALFVQPLPVA